MPWMCCASLLSFFGMTLIASFFLSSAPLINMYIVYMCIYLLTHIHVHAWVLCCFALFVCLTLLASFFLPSHLSFKNMYIPMLSLAHSPIQPLTTLNYMYMYMYLLLSPSPSSSASPLSLRCGAIGSVFLFLPVLTGAVKS